MSPIVVTILQDQCMVYKNEINDVIMTVYYLGAGSRLSINPAMLWVIGG